MIPVLGSDGRSERRGNEIHHDCTNFFVDILLLIVDSLLQSSLARILDVAGTKDPMHKPDIPSSHREYLQPDRRVGPRSRRC